MAAGPAAGGKGALSKGKEITKGRGAGPHTILTYIHIQYISLLVYNFIIFIYM